MVEFSPEFMKSRILDVVPKDTDVILLGENHYFIYHKKYLTQQLNDIKKKNIHISFERDFVSGNQMEYLFPIIGDKPEYMQKHLVTRNFNIRYDEESGVSAVFPYLNKHGEMKENAFLLNKYRILNCVLNFKMNFGNVHKLENLKKIEDKLEQYRKKQNYNYLPSLKSPYSSMQLLKAIKENGISYSNIDDYEAGKSNFFQTFAGYRNEKMAAILNAQSKENQMMQLYYGGNMHLFSHVTGDTRTEHGYVFNISLQSYLTKKYNLRTFSIGMITAHLELHPGEENSINNAMKTLAPEWFNESRWKKVIEQIKDEKKEVFVDLRQHINPKRVGVHSPDLLLVFPDTCESWEYNNYPKLLTHRRSPMTEADMWHRMDRDFNLKP